MSVEFEPIRLGRRGRRIDPITVGVLGVAIALAFAVLKPWAGATSGPMVAQAESSPALPTDDAVPTDDALAPDAVLPRVLAARSDASLRWDAVEGAVRRHDAWGIRTIVVQVLADSPLDARQRFIERWYPLPVDGDAARPILVDSNDRAILVLGITFPPAHTALDIRIWRKTDAGFDWVDAEALDPVPSGGAFLFRRPGPTPATPQTWSSGEYRLDILVDGGIRRFEIAIPDRFSNVPSPPERPSLRDLGPLVAPTDVDLTGLPVGAFATFNHNAIPLVGAEGAPLDEPAAWLDIDPGTGGEPRTFVSRLRLPRTTGLGVNLPARSEVIEAAMTRLAPEPLLMAPRRVDPGATGMPSGVVLFTAPDGAAWAPGVYQMTVGWVDVDGTHERSWHVELRPGTVRQTPHLLAAARGWARFAGENGVILGSVDAAAAGGPADPIQLVRLRPDAAEHPVATGIGCGGDTVMGGHPGILGFAYAADHYASSVKGRILRPFLRRDDQVLMTAAFGVPGLILAAPANSPTLPAATYEFRVSGDEAIDVYTLCLGMAYFGN